MIQRYECYLASYYNINFTEESLGNWCKYKDAVKLEQENQELKEVISKFIWVPDTTKEQWQEFKKEAAKLAGCTVPVFSNELPEVPNE